jgi:palmitoyltransferase
MQWPLTSRKNGFSYPRSWSQISSTVLYCVITALNMFVGFYSVDQSVTEHEVHWENVLLPLSGILEVSVVVTWLVVETIDPVYQSNGKAINLLCFPLSKLTFKFCPVCKKNVHGLDHHCIWLNTCIGNKNYVPFFLLICLMLVQFLVHIIHNIFILTSQCPLRVSPK